MEKPTPRHFYDRYIQDEEKPAQAALAASHAELLVALRDLWAVTERRQGVSVAKFHAVLDIVTLAIARAEALGPGEGE